MPDGVRIDLDKILGRLILLFVGAYGLFVVMDFLLDLRAPSAGISPPATGEAGEHRNIAR